jgi:hypothetical protein
MLKDYPEHVERLQEALNRLLEKRMPSAAPFERAIWLLEGRLETFANEAQEEMQVAQSGGDVELIAKAEAKEKLMSQACWKHVWVSDDALWRYFEQHEAEFK